MRCPGCERIRDQYYDIVTRSYKISNIVCLLQETFLLLHEERVLAYLGRLWQAQVSKET